MIDNPLAGRYGGYIVPTALRSNQIVRGVKSTKVSYSSRSTVEYCRTQVKVKILVKNITQGKVKSTFKKYSK